MSRKALIAMSGGVDSSVAAFMTKSIGFDCVGCTMVLFKGSPDDNTKDAGRVAERIGMPYHVFDYTQEFRENIIDRFVRSYENGITPNPCIDCNRCMKFGKLYEQAKILGCEYIVTGHYAVIEKDSDKYVLKKAKDETKDQSYVLYSLTQEQLAHTLFPLGSYKKTEIRKIAEDNGFVNANKPDSQDICFVPDGDYSHVVEEYSGKPDLAGDFVTKEGTVLGKHKGITHYTIGQRKGLGLSLPAPMFVCKICPENNTVVLGSSEDLFTDTAIVDEVNWISGSAPEKPFHCKAKTRYRQKEEDCTVYPEGSQRIKIVFDRPLRAITPGQSAVLYDGDVVLGGGVIVKI